MSLARRILFDKSVRMVSASTRSMCSTSASSKYTFKTVAVSNPSEHVFHVELNRPDKMNTLNKELWREIGECFSALGDDSDCRAIVLSGRGKIFTAGIDLSDIGELAAVVMGDEDIARKCSIMKKTIKNYQKDMSSLENCPKPVIAAVHGPCVGGGVDLTSAADIRYCSTNAWFQVKEVDVGLAADVGTLQRLPKVMGSESLVRELCFSARKLFSGEALKCGFISRIFEDREMLLKGALDLAAEIASKSPVAVQVTKTSLVYSRDHSVQDGLNHIADLNMSYLQSEDVRNAAMALMNKKKPVFAKL